jgi:hypothetical protein
VPFSSEQAVAKPMAKPWACFGSIFWKLGQIELGDGAQQFGELFMRGQDQIDSLQATAHGLLLTRLLHPRVALVERKRVVQIPDKICQLVAISAGETLNQIRFLLRCELSFNSHVPSPVC